MNTTPAVPSIVITAAVEPEISRVAQLPLRSPAATPGSSIAQPRNETVNDLLRHTKVMLRKGEHAIHFPPYQLLKALRSLARYLLQRSQALTENSSGQQDWERAALRRLRDILKDVLGLTAITRLPLSEVGFEDWQSARASGLRRLAAIKRLVERSINTPNSNAARHARAKLQVRA